MYIKKIFISPIKSCALLECESINFYHGVLEHDREYVLVDTNGKFISQRNYPVLSQIKQNLIDSYLVLNYKNSEIRIPLNIKHEESCDISIWEKEGDEFRHCFKMPSEYNEWFSEILGVKCILLKQDFSKLKPKDCGDLFLPIALHDSGAIHVIFEDEIDNLDLNEDANVSFRRFRPNIVVDRNELVDLESLENKILKIGSNNLIIRKKTIRCTIPYVNPQTGIPDEMSKEVLEKKYSSGGKVFFGIHIFPINNSGRISNGDTVTIEI